jgi:Asp-tRNA(Asn)/Glu-tRNA(Gln) amidotransferase A subunit family amidase
MGTRSGSCEDFSRLKLRTSTCTAAPTQSTFVSARKKFQSGEDTPRAYLDRCIHTIEARDKDVHAFVTLGLEKCAARCRRVDAALSRS